MLVKFTIDNVLSFKECNEFSMYAGKSKQKSERNIKVGNDEILKFSSIYGANASGKSNFIKALIIMKNIVGLGYLIAPNEKFSYLFSNARRPSMFEVGLVVDDKTYAYGFEIDFKSGKIIKEWLVEITNTKPKVVFERDSKLNTFTFKNVSSDFKKAFDKSFLNNKIIANSNFLALWNLIANGITLKDYKEYQLMLKIYNWFVYLSISMPNQSEITLIEQEQFDVNYFSELLEYFGTGIKKAKIEEKEKNFFDRTELLLSKDIYARIQLMRMISPNVGCTMLASGNSTWIISFSKNDIKFEEVTYYHDEEEKIPMLFSDESDGTKKIIHLIPMLFKSNFHTTYVIDELERSLHPLLTWQFIDSFLKLNKDNKSQLIVTSHETNIMDLNLLRRDEVWFVQKNNNSSYIYSLEEFEPRFDLRVNKAYLEGRFEGIPNFDYLVAQKLFNKGDK